jgi:hypothetical protein
MSITTNTRRDDIAATGRHHAPLRQRVRRTLTRLRRAIAERAGTWSPGVVTLGGLMLLAPVGEEIAEVAGYELSPDVHLVLVGFAFCGVAIYLLHKGTSDL